MRFEGGKELAAALRGLKAGVSKRIQREVLTDVAEPMRNAMSRNAPREPGAPDLADNIRISNGRKLDVVTDTEVAVRVGPTKAFFYGHIQEYGTVQHGPQPFMRPAFDAEAPKALTQIARRLWTELAARGVSRSTSVSTGLNDRSSSGAAGLGARRSFIYKRGKAK
jgi:HK97 gp10 family phage protein